MITAKTYPYQLDKSSKKFKCPSCQKKTFVKYIDNKSGDYLRENIGRCDRQNACGYHVPPREGLSGSYRAPQAISKPVPVTPMQIPYIPPEHFEASLINFSKTNFVKWLVSLFGEDVAYRASSEYFIGSWYQDNDRATIFWRIDKDRNIRTGKIIHYSDKTGNRIKNISPTWIHSFIPSFQKHEYQVCFFGEHLINRGENKHKTIGIVESEKTAIIASIKMPSIVWIAMGGQNGCKWREYHICKVLSGRDVILYPDYGYANRRSGKTCFEEWNERADEIREKISVNITVSKLLEDKLKGREREDQDLADLLLHQTVASQV
jgi:hypothetical protein